MNRRQFLSGLSVATIGAAREGRAQAPAAPERLRLAQKNVLRPEQFAYLGYYNVSLGGDFSYGQGLSHRYVDGQLRFLALRYSGSGVRYRLVEFLPSSAFGQTVSQATGNWVDIWGGRHGEAAGRFIGLWWEGGAGRLWSTAAIDYPNDEQAVRTGTMALTTLGASGTVTSVKGLFGLEGIGTRRIYGGVTKVPAWFSDKYSVGPYAVGFGGYTSRMNQGLSASMGPALYGFPDPSSMADGSVIPATQYKTLLDCSSGNGGADWYGGGATAPTSFDRGVRTGDYVNYYDNGSYPSTLGNWQLGPDGLGRWVWGDSAFQTGVWIDLPDVHGFVIIPTVHTGNVWYQNSTLNWNGKTAEFQVFDPDQLGEVALGSRAPWSVKPVHIWRPSWDVTPRLSGQGNNVQNTACAATFDEQSRRLYVRWTFAGGSWPYTYDRIFVWQVG